MGDWSANGDWVGTGDWSGVGFGGSASGSATATATLALSPTELAGSIAGTATIVANLVFPTLSPFQIPYPFLGTGQSVDELFGIVKGRSSVSTTLLILVEATSVTAGTAVVSGTISQSGTALLQSNVNGVATVSAWLVNQAEAGIVELQGTSDGAATVENYYWLTIDLTPNPVAQSRYLYLLCNIGVSFDSTDDDSGDSRFVSQSFLDGNTWDFNRYLYLLGNVGVSFDPTDDDSADPRFVSQTFEDGNVWDFSRYLYLLANVLAADPVAYGQLTINEGYRGDRTAIPARKPPSQGF